MATAEINTRAQFQELDPDRFEIEHDVPIFDQHSIEEAVIGDDGKPVVTVDDSGKPQLKTRTVKYSAAVLESMAENMNRRIRDTGDYTAICLGHTPTPEERKSGVPQPDLVGFAGPFYVGTIGGEEPRPAIIAKNWGIFKDEVDRARKYPRRSVEVWREREPHERYIEPIALLGAETPRRDLGLAYSRRHEGVAVERYTASSPVCPSGTNTFIPGGSDDEKRRYELPEVTDSQETNQETPTMALSDQDIQQIVAAVSEMAPMKWVESKMLEEQAKVQPEADPLAPAEGAEIQPEAPAPPAAPPDALAKDRNEEPEKEPEAMADKDDDETKTDAATEKYRKERASEKERYAQIESHNKLLASKVNEMAGQLKEVTDRHTKQERYSKINELDGQVIFDATEEYARVDGMTEEQFDAHLKLMREHYQKNPVGMPRIPVARSAKPGESEQAMSDRIKAKVDNYARQDIYKTYAELEAEVKRELNGQAV